MTFHQRAAASSPVTASGASVAAHLRARAPQYYPELPPEQTRVRLLGENVRAVSVLYRFLVEAGDESREIVVKIPLPVPESSEQPVEREAPGRPRLALPMRPGERFGREFRALAAMRAHFDGLGDARFGAVRVLDLLPEQQAFIMETVRGVSLRSLLHRSHRGRRGDSSRLEDAFHHTGAWLRAFQELRPEDRVQPRDTRREDFERFVERVCAYLGTRLDERPFFGRVSRAVVATAREALPEELPLGLGHGDFALRNILVGPASRVTVLDTVGRYLTPIYEDIGYFLVSLRYNWPQVLSLGAAFPAWRLAGYRQAFLSGYFGEAPVPGRAVRLYELQAALDLWASVASRPGQARSRAGRAKEVVRLALLSHCLRRRIAEEIRP